MQFIHEKHERHERKHAPIQIDDSIIAVSAVGYFRVFGVFRGHLILIA